jgi:hypothetical protein
VPRPHRGGARPGRSFLPYRCLVLHEPYEVPSCWIMAKTSQEYRCPPEGLASNPFQRSMLAHILIRTTASRRLRTEPMEGWEGLQR